MSIDVRPPMAITPRTARHCHQAGQVIRAACATLNDGGPQRARRGTVGASVHLRVAHGVELARLYQRHVTLTFRVDEAAR